MSSRPSTVLAVAILLSNPAIALIVLFGDSGIVIVDNTELIATGNSLAIDSPAPGQTSVTGWPGQVQANVLDPTQAGPDYSQLGDRTLTIGSLDPYAYADLEVLTDSNTGGTLRLVGNSGLPSEHVYLSASCTELMSVEAVVGTEYVPEFASHVAEVTGVTLSAGYSSFVGDLIAELGATPNEGVSFSVYICVETGQWAVAYDRIDASFTGIHDGCLHGLTQGTVSQIAHDSITGTALSAEANYDDSSDLPASGYRAQTLLSSLQADVDSFESSGDITDPGLADQLQDWSQLVIDAIDLHSNYPLTEELGAPL